MGESTVKVQRLVKRYGDLVAVNDISFEVQPGEIFAFLGPNGAGKTTTVEILECLRPLTSGEVTVLGENVADARGTERIKKRIGVLPQDFNALRRLTARENVELVALPEVFVSCETVQEAVVEMQPPPVNVPQQKQRRWVRLTWLHAAIAMLRRQCLHVAQLQGILYAYLAALDRAIRCAYVAQHRLHQPLVCATPVFIEGRQVGWRLRVGVPASTALAA